MSAASRPVSTGKTRTCPHCKATILESLSICPGCMHHLRFDSEAAKRQVAAAPALRVEGIIRHPPLEQPLEYFVIIAIRNDRGEEVTRQVVNVGALQAAEKRTFTLSVEVLPPSAPVPTKSNTSTTGTFKSTASQPAMASPPVPPAAQPATGQAQPSGVTSSPATTPAAPPAATVPRSNLNPLAPTPNNPGAPVTGRPGSPVSQGSGAKPAGPPPAGSAAPPGSPTNPASAPKPSSGYTLKPPSPGGPKRH